MRFGYNPAHFSGSPNPHHAFSPHPFRPALPNAKPARYVYQPAHASQSDELHQRLHHGHPLPPYRRTRHPSILPQFRCPTTGLCRIHRRLCQHDPGLRLRLQPCRYRLAEFPIPADFRTAACPSSRTVLPAAKSPPSIPLSHLPHSPSAGYLKPHD